MEKGVEDKISAHEVLQKKLISILERAKTDFTLSMAGSLAGTI